MYKALVCSLPRERVKGGAKKPGGRGWLILGKMAKEITSLP